MTQSAIFYFFYSLTKKSVGTLGKYCIASLELLF